MGRLLQIRLLASTYDIEALPKVWPSLCLTVWPEDKAVKALNVAGVAGGRGVLDLVNALAVALECAGWPEAKKQILTPHIKAAQDKVEELSQALSEWNPKAANKASDELEALLDELERLMKNFI